MLRGTIQDVGHPAANTDGVDGTVKRLLEHGYRSRLWVVHEILLASDFRHRWESQTIWQRLGTIAAVSTCK